LNIVCDKLTDYLPKATIKASKDVVDYIKEVWPVDINHREAFVALYLNRRNNTIGYAVIGTGGLAATVADGKIVFQNALLCNASAIILIHNHPSDSSNPSQTDIELTKKLVGFGKMIDMSVLDHIIISDTNFYSFADNGQM